MPELLLILFVSVVRTVAEACKAIRRQRATKPRPLCTDCVHAHAERSACDRLHFRGNGPSGHDRRHVLHRLSRSERSGACRFRRLCSGNR
jgi:hypothetical protein